MSATDVDVVDLSSNTNAWGVPPGALAAAAEALAAGAAYPSVDVRPLREAIALDLGLAVEQVTAGCGSDDLLATAFRAFARPGDTLAASVPTFSMVEVFAGAAGLRFAGLPFGPGFSLDVEGLLAIGADLAYVCSPNNPTGTTVTRDDLRGFLDRFAGFTVLDEAYVDFGGESMADLITTYDRLLVTRTFSKAYGLAGLRVGFAIGTPGVIRTVDQGRGPYAVSAPGERAAIASLRPDGRRWVDEHVVLARAGRDRLQAELTRFGIGYVPSMANFVLIPVPDAVTVAEALARRGYAVRALAALPGIGDAVRITVGPGPEMAAVAGALREALS